MIEAKAFRNADADSSQRGCVGRKSVFPAEAHDPVAYLKFIWAYICSYPSDSSSGFDSEQTDRKFDNTQRNQNILYMLY